MDWIRTINALSRRVVLPTAIGLLGSLLLFTPAHAAEDYAIFSLDSGFEEISINKARKLYRGKTKRLNGKRVELSDWPENSTEREDFYQLLLGKNAAQMNAHWAGLSFSGKARYPREIKQASADSLVNWLDDKPNRIGYSPLSSVPQNANVLYVISSEK
ncbi:MULTISPECIES: hypothetical protein [Vibrio]|jgi:hypothetical protein|uniref:Phosphate ABC transporter substrate-binding protein n=2 Tax=Vibrio TaxID=662 RepID=A0A7Y4G0F5_VIBSP|nr:MULTISPECIES: hypothetical protein [Vibrio]OED74812.1 hypothetical protein A143_00920 [Vibrio splendidus ZS-139]TVU60563.1 hypothetical protein FQP88_16715 [Vibrio atlanticus]TVU78670.1 hypothetical protein FQP87_04790 [Vibrio tasmaniensis]MCF7502829.1 hypothetical protein [Vibrio sp. L3-7]NOJ14628.1 hypothetical protein [Vibrio splendidus]|tara:strand:- start:21 stop:497 length:477 start_codon:yes stop_codon:yes gene_type:complete